MKTTVTDSLELQINDLDKQINNLLTIRNDLFIKYCNIIDVIE